MLTSKRSINLVLIFDRELMGIYGDAFNIMHISERFESLL